MRKLRGTLNVACFEEAFEDAEYVHIVMEWCRGGELHHRIGDKHYSERTVRPPSSAPLCPNAVPWHAVQRSKLACCHCPVAATQSQHLLVQLQSLSSVIPQQTVRCGCQPGAR